MGYQEIEIDVIGFGGKVEKRYINLSNINYYRAFIDSSPKMGEKPKLQTMVYFKDSVKATFVDCSCEVFKEKIKEITKN